MSPAALLALQVAVCCTSGGNEPVFPALPSARRLHIILMLVDELGTGDVPWSDPQMHAPTIKALGEGGLRLGHQYAWHWCAPTRSALMSGRLPMHSGYKLGPQSGSQPGMPGHGCGLDLKLPLLPAELKAANYATHMLGKWHLGYRTKQNLPTHRGFDTYLGLLGGGSDHFQKTLCVPGSGHDLNSLCPCGPNPNKSAPLLPYRVDYWDGDGPAHSVWDNHTYDAYDFGARAVQLVHAHNASQNFFLYWAPHKVHSPLQAAPEFLAHYPLDPGHRCMSTPETCRLRGWGVGIGCGCPEMCYCNRRIFRAMLSSVDAMLTNLTSAMHTRGMWNDTLIFFLGDNGGPSNAAA